jgi:hypothetical protein
MAGKAVRMKFTLIMQNSVTTNKNFFRVLVNGTRWQVQKVLLFMQVTSITRNLTYDLAVCRTKFSVVLTV